MTHFIENYSLQECTTFHLPVKCRYFVEYSTISELRNILNSDIYKNNVSFHMGGGSNLVFTKDFEGLILHSLIKYIDIVDESHDHIILKVGSGVDWDSFVKYCVENGYYGIENMSYIPGEVGASAVQNIGSYGVEVKDVITKVHCVDENDGSIRIFTNEECEYGYRDSIFKNEYKNRYIVIGVEYRLSKIPQYSLEYGALKALQGKECTITLADVRNEIIRIRTEKLPDPKYIGSAGSFFKNPVIPISKFNELKKEYPTMPHYIVTDDTMKIPAGWLIENAGLKGYKLGGARVYDKQCLVLVNDGDASAHDIVDLYKYVISRVNNKYGIELSPEANIL